jgi:ion channel-forming bestrophin family protein
MLPLALLDVFEREAEREDFASLLTHEYVFTLVPFSVLISWIFLMMEKVSESHEDPFEGGLNDVPLSAIFRLIEIDVKQVLQEKVVPAPLQPVDDALY